MIKIRKTLERLHHDNRAAALTEFAFALPLVLGGGLFGIETAYFTVIHMRVNQAAAHIADNASRIGDTSTIDDRKIYEDDVRDLMIGADIQLKVLDLYEHGRVIVSSLETDRDVSGEPQWLHWQRCMGKLGWYSTYGEEGDRSKLGEGMGRRGEKVSARTDEPVMFVEVAYEYQPLFSEKFIGQQYIHSFSAFTVRADRDLSQIYQRDDFAQKKPAECDIYEDLDGNSGDGTKVNEQGSIDGPGEGPGGAANDDAAPGTCHTTMKDGYHCHEEKGNGKNDNGGIGVDVGVDVGGSSGGIGVDVGTSSGGVGVGVGVGNGNDDDG